MRRLRLLAVVALAGADLAVLILLRPRMSRLIDAVSHPRTWVQRDGIDEVVLELGRALLWVVAAWLALGLLLAVGQAVPGAVGGWAGAATRRILPSIVQRLLAGTLGVGVMLGPAVAATAVPHRPAEPVASASASPSWPVDASAPAAGSPSRGTSPGWPGTDTRRPPTHHAPPIPPPPSKGEHRPATRAHVEVRPGDTLWSIAAAHLGPDATEHEIAAAWPHWYVTNRDVIGRDPGLIEPGQVLVVPEAAGHGRGTVAP